MQPALDDCHRAKVRHGVPRRSLLAAGAAALTTGCVGIPLADRLSTSRGTELLRACARAHGDDAWKGVRDISVSYEGQWYGLVARLQPELVDERYRKQSQERILPGVPLVAQQHQGPGGEKFVLRQASERAGTSAQIQVRYDGTPSPDADRVAASALVADAYRMFLTAPFMFGADSMPAMSEAQWLDGRRMQVVVVRCQPGLGWDGHDRVALFVDDESFVLRRVRFTIDALPSTKGAVVEVDLDGHRRIDGVLWPTQFFERIRTPVPMLPAHRWWMTGLDVNRGLSAADFRDARFSARAARPAKPLTG
jgi:hypothetical protein